jgi:hypothetical protein
MQIADVFGTIGTKLEEQAVIKADNEGANAVYRDPAGQLKVDERSNWSKSGQAYNRAAQQAFSARVAGDIRTQGQTLFNEAQGDVKTFDTSWNAFKNKLLSNTPKDYRGPVQTMLESEGSRFQLGVSEQKRKRDVQVFENDIKTEVSLLDDEMSALARAGGTGTSAYLEKQSQLKSLYGELSANPEFSVSDKQAEIELKRVESRHMSEAVIGQIDKTLATGGVGAAKKEIDRLLTDDKLSLSPAERRQYAGIASQRVEGFVAEAKVALKPVQDASKNYQKMFDQGVGLDNPEVDNTIATLARGGDITGAFELSQARNVARAIASAKNSDPAKRLDMLENSISAANSPGNVAAATSPEAIKEYRAGVTADAKALWPDIKAGITRGIPPSAEEFGLLSRQLSVIDDPQLRSEVSTFMQSEAAGAMIAALPADQAASVISSLKADAADGASVAQQQIIEAADRSAKATAEALKNDPIGFASDRGMAKPVPPIDLAAGPDAVSTAFASRQNAVDLLQARGTVGNISALRPEDTQLLTRVMTSATPGEQAQLLGTMAKNLAPDTYKATVAALSAEPDNRAFAVAGALYHENRDVSEAILRGRALIAANEHLAPKKNPTNSDIIDKFLPSSSFGNGLEASRQLMLEAATARYADLSNVYGDTTGELNSDRMEQAIKEVTGGTFEWNGQQVISPRYGMSRRQFVETMRSLPTEAVSGAITSDGTPISAREVQDYGRLKAVGDGQYLIEFGLSNAPTYAMSENGPFILDLRK